VNWRKILSVKVSEKFLILFGILFLLRLPSLFEPYWYGDEGIYLTLGMALRKGLVWYRDIHDNKPPLLYLIAALAGTQFWFRTILLFWNGVNTFLIYKLALKIFNKKNSGLIAAFIFIFLSLIAEGNIANGEIFMIMPVTAGMLTLFGNLEVKSQKSKVKIYLISGVLFSLAFLFKAPAAFSFLAALVFLFFFKNIKKIIILIIGFIILPLLSVIYYWSQGALSQYITAAFKQNTGYVSSWGAGGIGFSHRILVMAVIILILFFLKKHFRKEFLLIALWFFFDLFASLLSARPYPHYLIQLAPSVSLLLLFLASKLSLEKIFVILATASLASAFFYYKFWRYPVWTYYQNFVEFAVGAKSKNDYFAFFDARVGQTYQLAAWVKALTGENERIFIWGDEPYVYALSARLPAGRYTVAYHIIDFSGWQDTLSAINSRKPSIIIMVDGEEEFAALELILKQQYLKINKIGKGTIYKRI